MYYNRIIGDSSNITNSVALEQRREWLMWSGLNQKWLQTVGVLWNPNI